jgi:hypothetical protein
MNRYSPKAQKEIAATLDEYNAGTLHSGTNKQRVKSRQQALAIGIAKARGKHYKVPDKE